MFDFDGQVDVHHDEQTFCGDDKLNENSCYAKSAGKVAKDQDFVDLRPVGEIPQVVKLEHEAHEAEEEVDKVEDGMVQEVLVDAVLELFLLRKHQNVDGVCEESDQAYGRQNVGPDKVLYFQ